MDILSTNFKLPRHEPPSSHEKEWGYELWLVNNNLYCGKLMKLSPRSRCSTHRHLRKTETFHVLEGAFLLYLNGDWIQMREGSTVTIKPDEWHCFINPSSEMATFLEVSTPHFDHDVVRLDCSKRLTSDEIARAKKIWASLESRSGVVTLG